MNVVSMHGMSTLQPSVLSTKGEQETVTLGLRPILLIVDDDDDVRILISDLLHKAGYSLMEARDGAEALSQLHGAPQLPAAILTDLSMPGIDGWQLIESVRSDPRLFAIPIIVISSSMSPPTGVCCLGKPVGHEALMRALIGIGVAGLPGVVSQE